MRRLIPVRAGFYAVCECGYTSRRYKLRSKAQGVAGFHVWKAPELEGHRIHAIVQVTPPEALVWAAAAVAGQAIPRPEYLQARARHMRSEAAAKLRESMGLDVPVINGERVGKTYSSELPHA